VALGVVALLGDKVVLLAEALDEVAHDAEPGHRAAARALAGGRRRDRVDVRVEPVELGVPWRRERWRAIYITLGTGSHVAREITWGASVRARAGRERGRSRRRRIGGRGAT